MGERSRANHRTSGYVYGSAVRQLEPQRRERVYEEGRRVKETTRELRNRDRALQMNGAYVFFLAAVSVFCLAMGVLYLNIQADINNTRTGISELKKDINTLTAKNEAINYSIDGYIDVNHIYKVATGKLGMVEADSDQVAFYKSTDSEYTVQFGDIPSK